MGATIGDINGDGNLDIIVSYTEQEGLMRNSNWYLKWLELGRKQGAALADEAPLCLPCFATLSTVEPTAIQETRGINPGEYDESLRPANGVSALGGVSLLSVVLTVL